MFASALPDPGGGVVAAGQPEAMADLFAIVGFATVSLLCVARWWEER
jgi:hypothetical protein